MPYNFASLPSNLNDLSSAIQSAPNNSVIYVYKDGSGNIKSTNDEAYINQINNLGIGNQFTFLNGDVIYSITPYSTIPWTYAGASTLPTYDATNIMWVDAMEPRSLNVNLQKVLSKSYTNNTLSLLDGSNTYDFSYASNTIDLSSGTYLYSSSIAFPSTFAFGLVFSMPNTINTSVIFQHSNIVIKLATQNALSDGTPQIMICLYNNNTFVKGITLNPSATPTFKYCVYADSSNVLIVNGNTSNFIASNTFTGSSASVYIGVDSGTTTLSKIKLNEFVYYSGTATSSSAIINYLTSRWSISNYTDSYNIAPISESFALLFDSNSSYWGQYTYKPNATTISTISNGFTLGNNGYRVTWTSSARASEMGIPLGITNPVNVTTAKTNGTKYYVEFLVQFNSNTSANTGIGFMDILTSRMDIDYQVQGNNGGHFTMDRMWGNNWNGSYALYTSLGGGAGIAANTGSQTIPDMTQSNLRVGLALDYSTSSAVTFKMNYNNSGGYTINTSGIASCPIPLNGALLVPCIYQYGSNGGTCFIEYQTQANALYTPNGYTYIT